jgi:hypothetical protein
LLWNNASFYSFVSAQNFAAELATKGNVTRILIGGGYGLSGNTKKGSDPNSGFSAELEGIMISMTGVQLEDAIRPEIHRAVFEVEILDERTTCFAERAGMGRAFRPLRITRRPKVVSSSLSRTGPAGGDRKSSSQMFKTEWRVGESTAM